MSVNIDALISYLLAAGALIALVLGVAVMECLVVAVLSLAMAVNGQR